MTEDVYLLPKGYLLQEFEIRDHLGEGGFGVTYLAYDESLDTEVVLKEYLPQGFAKRNQGSTVLPLSENNKADFVWGLTRFQDEARTLAKFKDNNIVNVNRVFPANGTAYMSMEFLRGGSLEDRLRSGSLTENTFLPILDQIISGLKLVHAQDFLHRDIAPDNIMFRDEKTPVLIDFGAARMAVGSRSKPLSAIVKEGYAPIEQYNEKSPQGPFTDIYALSAVCYEVITGKRPLESTVRFDADVDPVEPLAGRVSGWSPAFLKAVDWGLSLRRQDRPQSLDEWQASWKNSATSGAGATVGSGPDTGPLPQDASLLQMIRNAWVDGIITPQERDNIYIAAEAFGRDQAWVDANIQSLRPVKSTPLPPPGGGSAFVPPQVTEPGGKGLKIFLIAFILLAIVGGGFFFYDQQQKKDLFQRDKAAYELALKENTISSYQIYLKKFPKGEFETEARQKLDQLLDKQAYDAAVKEDSEASYKRYLNDFPSGAYRAQANKRLAQLAADREDRQAYNAARSKNTEAAYKDYLDNYPNGNYRAQAQAAYEKLRNFRLDHEAYNRAKSIDTIAAYEDYLRQFPKGAYRISAQNRIDSLSKSNETKDYNALYTNKNYSKHIAFLDKYPSSSYKGRVAYDLGRMYLYGENGATKDYSQAWKYYNISADNNYASGIHQVGYMYAQGYYVSQNYTTARSWFNRSANMNNEVSMEWMGYLYQNGLGVTKNLEQALYWYEKAQKAGNKTQNVKNYIKTVKKQLGDQYYKTGRDYEDGSGGKSQSYATAYTWFKKAADMDDAGGYSKMGYYHHTGRGGITKDNVVALGYMRKAADLGDMYGLFNVGVFYENGYGGLTRSDANALVWYKKSADAGYSGAQYQVGRFYEYGKSVTVNYYTALPYYRKAADAGNKDAMRALARFYDNGYGGLAKNPGQANYWRNKAK